MVPAVSRLDWAGWAHQVLRAWLEEAGGWVSMEESHPTGILRTDVFAHVATDITFDALDVVVTANVANGISLALGERGHGRGGCTDRAKATKNGAAFTGDLRGRGHTGLCVQSHNHTPLCDC